MVKSLIEVSQEFPFTSDFDFFFESDTLIFTIFYINPTASDESRAQYLQEVFQELSEFLKPWRKYYTWNDNPLDIKLVEDSLQENNRYSYVYGHLQFGNSLSDEWLVVSLIITFFTIFCSFSFDKQDILIHFFDQDGEFLLIESPENIPDWCEPSNTFNRIWINGNGDLLLIPHGSTKNANQIKSLKLTEAVSYMMKYNYLIDKNSLVKLRHEIWNNRLKNAITEALSYTVFNEVKINRKVASIILKLSIYRQNHSLSNTEDHHLMIPNVFSRSFGAYIENLTTIDLQKSLAEARGTAFEKLNFKNADDLIVLWIPMSLLHYTVLKSRHSNPQNKEIPMNEFLGEALSSGFQSFVADSDVDVQQYTQKLSVEDDLEDISLSNINDFILSNPLQQSLLTKGVLKEKVSTIDLNKFEKEVSDLGKKKDESLNSNNNINEEKLMEKIKNFIQERDLENNPTVPKIPKNEKPEDKGGNDLKNSVKNDDINLDDYYNDDSDYSSGNENEEVINYLKKEKISITEDDFFEYFLTEALNIPKDELEDYRSIIAKNKNQVKDEEEIMNGKKRKPKREASDYDGINDDEYDTSQDQFEGNGEYNISEEDIKSLGELMKLLQTNNGNEMGNPGFGFLQNFMSE
ncbi:hypothetical protein DASC09_044210 [Saccharomycopsis crataegensis]|uniref:SGT1-domain-containing protein n=1 Tax=Saccharomycopsis crataegensis TaxID=43959 RepID=A0AAV5QR87_9ASCO|nr:hypothetical protein DASC09_044210 [Saccharomycopsis crataegensis]